MIALLLALASPAAHAWGHHYLVTDRALQHDSTRWTERTVRVETLDAFLAAAPQAVATAVDAHYDWLQARGSERFLRQSFPTEAPTRAAFLQAARPSPTARMPLVVRVVPGQERPTGTSSTRTSWPMGCSSPTSATTPCTRGWCRP